MGTLRAKTIEPATGSTLTLGASGDTVTVSSDSIKVNTFKDAGGNTLFISDGAGTLSSVNSGFGAGPILISTSTASGDSSVAITSGIDSTYDEYMFVITDIGPATDYVEFAFQCSTDSGSNYNTTVTSTHFEVQHWNDDSDASILFQNSASQEQGTAYQVLANQLGAGADESSAGILHLFSPASTTYVKHFYARYQSSFEHVSAGSGQGRTDDDHYAGYFNTTSAIDAISFKMSSGNFDGVIQMYGIG